MSASCSALECMLCLGCTRWAWRRCTFAGSDDSKSWPLATLSDFSAIPRFTLFSLSSYSPSSPELPSSATLYKYVSSPPLSPPYAIYTDQSYKEIILAVQGLGLSRQEDYRLLLDNPPGSQPFKGGFVHRGLLRAATWLLEQEGETIRQLMHEGGKQWRFVVVGHSLGAGVAALTAVLATNELGRYGFERREQVRCFIMAPPRCMSLSLAVEYADVISSVILQDDFLPRTATPLQHMFGSIFW
ncbi:hypothetical protein LUZ61_001405 [Rhynchospora tenuis]|uniref:Fungal lipase-like domain-containing protein n=1 Tax=Rhynchospora tenuis TaxID=198213 RepID=A0AAD5ZGY5_9POAL|nr:hypothetical protein LUZ61_001405 [Rhynchospora tenuis]